MKMKLFTKVIFDSNFVIMYWKFKIGRFKTVGDKAYTQAAFFSLLGFLEKSINLYSVMKDEQTRPTRPTRPTRQTRQTRQIIGATIRTDSNTAFATQTNGTSNLSCLQVHSQTFKNQMWGFSSSSVSVELMAITFKECSPIWAGLCNITWQKSAIHHITTPW